MYTKGGFIVLDSCIMVNCSLEPRPTLHRCRWITSPENKLTGRYGNGAHTMHPVYFYLKGGTLRYSVQQNTYHQPYTMHVVDGKNTHTHTFACV